MPDSGVELWKGVYDRHQGKSVLDHDGGIIPRGSLGYFARDGSGHPTPLSLHLVPGDLDRPVGPTLKIVEGLRPAEGSLGGNLERVIDR